VNKQQAQFVRDEFLRRFSSQYNTAARGIDKEGNKALTFQQQFPIIEEILIRAGFNFNDTIRKNLEKANAISSGGLVDVSAPQVTSNANGFTLSVGYPIGSKQMEYYDFVNKGVAGVGGKNAKPKKNSGDYRFKSKFPNRKMAASIFSWLNKARKSVRTDRVDLSGVQRKRRRLATTLDEATNKKRLAYAISSAIKRDGIKATYYFDRAIQENFTKDFKDALSVALGGDIILQIRQYGNNNSN
jgi:hypothetical protein